MDCVKLAVMRQFSHSEGLPHSRVELRREEPFSNVWQIATVSLFDVVWVNQLLHVVEIPISIDREFLFRELIDELMCKLPKLAHDPGDIDREEAE